MTTPALVKSADLKRMADIAKSKGVTVWIEMIDGRRIGVSPDIHDIHRQKAVPWSNLPTRNDAWRIDNVPRRRRIFCEQFDKDLLARYCRLTRRLETIVHHLGLAPGGRPAAALPIV